MRLFGRFLVLMFTALSAWGMVNIYISMKPIPHGKTPAWVAVFAMLALAACLWHYVDTGKR